MSVIIRNRPLCGYFYKIVRLKDTDGFGWGLRNSAEIATVLRAG